MELGTAIALFVWGTFAVSEILRLRRRGAGTFDDSFEPRDQIADALQAEGAATMPGAL